MEHLRRGPNEFINQTYIVQSKMAFHSKWICSISLNWANFLPTEDRKKSVDSLTHQKILCTIPICTMLYFDADLMHIQDIICAQSKFHYNFYLTSCFNFILFEIERSISLSSIQMFCDKRATQIKMNEDLKWPAYQFNICCVWS